MSDSYQKVKGGRLTFKGGSLATSSKTIEKNKKKKNKKNKKAGEIDDETQLSSAASTAAGEVTENVETGEVYTIDAAKRMKYEELFPVETKKFGYHGKANFKSLEDALDDRVKKKADRYCK